MECTYRYPEHIRQIVGHKSSRIAFPEQHLEQTHRELMLRLDDPSRSIPVWSVLPRPVEQVWEVAAGSISRFFAHQPGYLGRTAINALGPAEGGRFIVHRRAGSEVVDRLAEVLVNLEQRELTISDIDVADPSVAGSFPALFTIKLEQDPDEPDSTLMSLSYTMLGVAPEWVTTMLVYQMLSIREHLAAVV